MVVLVGPSGRTPFELDPGIAGLVRVLNDSGYVTAFSCSGLLCDHLGGKKNVLATVDSWSDMGLPYIIFRDGFVSVGLRSVLVGLGFSVRRVRRGRPGVFGRVRARLGGGLPDAGILEVFGVLGEWVDGNPFNGEGL